MISEERCSAVPDALRAHLTHRLAWGLSSLQLDPRALETSVRSFLLDIHTLGALRFQSGSDFKNFNRWLANTGEVVSRCFQIHPHIARRAVENELAVSDVINFWMEAKGQNEKIFHDITHHHQSLVTHGWSHLDSAEDSTQSYAIAAAEMGKKEWVRDINEWMEIQILKYFRYGGARKHYLKALSNENRSTSTEVVKDLFEGDHIIAILDIGSCYNYFLSSKNANLFEIVAFDLCPAHESVFRGDFLKIHIGDRFHAEAECDLSISNSEYRIVELPMNRFDAITLSLVLSYLPSFRERELVVEKARKLLVSSSGPNLHHQGLLVIAEKASIFSRSKKNRDLLNHPTPEDWIEYICLRGFRLVTYQNPTVSRHQVHLFVFSIDGNVPELTLTQGVESGCRLRIRNED